MIPLVPLLLLLLLCVSASGGQECSIPEDVRIDCGYFGIGQEECEQQRSCCWLPEDEEWADIPWCFFPTTTNCGHYAVAREETTETGMALDVDLSTAGCAFFGPDIEHLRVEMTMETNDRLHVKITDRSAPRYEVPEELFPRPVTTTRPSDPSYLFSYSQSPFGFAVSRAEDEGMVLFNSTAASTNPLFRDIIFEDQYLEISTPLTASSSIYGLGERVRELRLEPGLTYTLWTVDAATPENHNLYGAHPFYLEVRDGLAHGVLLMNSNGMDVVYENGALTYKVIGGVLDFYFFLGPTPGDVIAQYTELIGRPYFMPYWAFGFHQCRYGYKNIEEVREVVRSFRENDIPLETMWIDIDYMDEFRDWTFDEVNYPPEEITAFIDELHSNRQRNVLITDPCIKNETGYKYFDVGIEMDVFIKDAETDGPALGMVWPLYTVFPDWFHPNTSEYWRESIRDFREIAPIDGIWIDMNEVANFCNGADLSTCSYPYTSFPLEKHRGLRNAHSVGRGEVAFEPNDPPYRINNFNSRADLNIKTMDMDAYHADGNIEYDVHNMFGFAEHKLTTEAMEDLLGKRTLVLSRSTFPGSGKYGGHWTGDNHSTWPHLYFSIPGMLAFQMFGVPFVGADICGFIQDTTEELCARWMQLGSFYPFSRNHNAIGAASQEPYRWESVAEVSRIALGIRYTLLPIYYTLNYLAHTSGETIVRPLFFEFPSDPVALSVDRQFLLGNSVLFTPVLEQGATSVEGYFPPGRWYDYYTQDLVFENDIDGGTWETLDAPLEVIPIHVRGGSVLPLQDPGYTTFESRQNDFSLLVALDEDGVASGFLYLDDGESFSGSNSQISFAASTTGNAGVVYSEGTFGYNAAAILDHVVISGLPDSMDITCVKVNGVEFASHRVSYSKLVLDDLQLSMNAPFEIHFD